MSSTPTNPHNRSDPTRRDAWDEGFRAGIYEGEAHGIPDRRERDRLIREIRNAAGQTTDAICRDALLRAIGESDG